MKLTIIYKLGLGAVLLVLVSAGMVGSLFYNKTTQLLVEQSAQDIADEINDAGSRLRANIDAQEKDTRFLSNTPPIQGMLRALKVDYYDKQDKTTYQNWRQRLQSIFKNVLKSKPEYLKIRYISKDGQEVVAVDRNNDAFIGLRNRQLQNKAHRDYVRDTIKLAKGEIYLSEINLNREHGKVSIPHQQVLRSATPVYDEQTGEISGLVVVVAEMSHAFKAIRNNVETESSKIYITNDHGGYLLHPDANKSYGFDLGKRYRIQEEFPQLATMYLPDNKDTKFIQLPKDRNDKHVLNFTKIAFDQNHPERFIAVGITELYSNILAKQKGVLTNVVTVASILALGVVLLAILFAYRLSHPIKQITQVMDDYTHHRKTTATMPTNRGDEIGVLAQSYENLINQIEDGRKNLEDLNQNLGTIVTERTLELESSEAFQRSIIENMADGLITSDRSGVILSFNSAAESIFGYKQEELLGKNLSVLMPTSIGSHHDKYLDSYKKSGVKRMINTRRETEGQRKDGSTFPLDLSVSEIQINDQHLFSGVIRDITERKQMDKMKNEFVSTVSHELRTPLTAIRGSLGLINGGALGEVPEKISDLLIVAGNNTERLLLLINDILDLQKIESGLMTFSFENMDVMPFLQQVVQENKAYGEQFGVEFVISSSEDAQIHADKDRMKQVLANLLSNAAKFSPENGKIEIAVTNTNECIQISVTDHGPGIPEDFQSILFEKFTQSDSTTTRKTGSTGLGLSITKKIVETHGGEISFISQEGVGTTFIVKFPKSKKTIN